MHMLFTLRLSHRDGYLARLAAQSRIFIRLNMSYYEIIIILPLFTFFLGFSVFSEGEPYRPTVADGSSVARARDNNYVRLHNCK